MPETITSGLGKLPIRAAVQADFAALVALLREAQAWIDQRGLHQWVPGAHDPALVEAMIRHGSAYVVEHEGRVIATCALRESLPAHWPPRHEPIGYLSTLTVKREFSALGLGSAIIRWAESALRDQGKVWACLDCSSKNPRLYAYYETQGYVGIGGVETYPDYIEQMMQKRLTSAT